MTFDYGTRSDPREIMGCRFRSLIRSSGTKVIEKSSCSTSADSLIEYYDGTMPEIVIVYQRAIIFQNRAEVM